MSNSIVEVIEKFNKVGEQIQALEDRLKEQEALTASLEGEVRNLEDIVEYLRGLAM